MASRNGDGPRYRIDDTEARRGHAFRKRSPSSRYRDSSPARYAVTDGRDAIGTVELIDGAYVATIIEGEIVGTFASLREACRAFDRGCA